jgi:hypothetical protein
MASITVARDLNIAPELVWDALRDWEALQRRLVPGFVVNTNIQDGDRILTFANGMVARERLVDLDDQQRRLVWTVIDGPFAHYNGAARVLATEEGGSRFVWTSDLLPDELAGGAQDMMNEGIEVIASTLQSALPIGGE